jgi:hypothetical protein
VSFLCDCDQILDINNIKEEGFFCFTVLGVFHPWSFHYAFSSMFPWAEITSWWQEKVAEEVLHLLEDRKLRKTETEDQMHLQSHATCDFLPPA